MQNSISIPNTTQRRLEKLLADRQTLQVLIDTTVLTTREALDVPDGWTLSSLTDGFIAPTEDKGGSRMANVNIPDLAALTAPAATDEIEVYDASAAANVRLALSYVALLGTAQTFSAAQSFTGAINMYKASSDTPGTMGLLGGNNAFWGFRDAVDGTFNLDSFTTSSSYRSSLSITRDGVISTVGHVLIGTPTDAAQLTVKAGSTSTVGLVVDTRRVPRRTLLSFATTRTEVYD
jgi:hypothetical protein